MRMQDDPKTIETAGRALQQAMELSKLQAELAAKDAEIERLRNAVLWALGEVGEFPPNPASPDAKGIQRRPYYWRTELRSRAFGERNSGGTPE